MNTQFLKRFCLIFGSSLLVFGITWLVVMDMNLHPYYVEITESDETLIAEGHVISGEISADASDPSDTHQISMVEREKQNLTMNLQFSIIFFSLFIVSIFHAWTFRGMPEKEKTYKQMRNGALGILVSLLLILLQYGTAGNLLNTIFSS